MIYRLEKKSALAYDGATIKKAYRRWGMKVMSLRTYSMSKVKMEWGGGG